MATGTPAGPPTGAAVVADAGTWVAAKVPYLWGGVTRFGADCSGMVQTIFGELGVKVGRTTGAQYAQGATVPLGPASDPFANALPGDVIFYGMGNTSSAMQHEGIYAGGGQIINEPHTGAVASYASAAGDTAEPLSGIRRFTAPGATTLGFNPFDPLGIVGAAAGAAGDAIGAGGGSVASDVFGGLTKPLISWVDSVAVRALLVVVGATALILGLAKLTGPARAKAASAGEKAAPLAEGA